MNKLNMQSKDFVKDNIEKIFELFPDCIVEAYAEDGSIKRSIDFDQLKQNLSNVIVDGAQERYQLTWPGKHESLLLANSPVAKTLRPSRIESVEFDNTKNIFIEGDNLDALKLLQESYLNKVKMIYIDPPYNTGNDFIYDDDFSEDSESYFLKSNQKDSAGNKMFANMETNGRFHSDWLSMMYPRLKLARNLLRDDGVILISIDDGEIANLRKICDEIFGQENFVAEFFWKSRQNKDNRNKTGISVDHEYILCFSKSYQQRVFKGADRNISQYTNPDGDARGPWTSGNMVGLLPEDQRPNCHYDLVNPETQIIYSKPEMGWRYDQTTMKKMISENRILWPNSPQGRPRKKTFLNELNDEYTGFSSIIGEGIYTRHGTEDIYKLFNKRLFDFPKPKDLLKILIAQTTIDDDLILDFFSGSATTAHAIMELNAEDMGNRHYIMVQLNEDVDKKSESFKSGYKAISDIGKERIIRAGKIIKEEQMNRKGIKTLDVGFRVLKVDTSNMKDVYYKPDAIQQADIFDQVDNIKDDRSPEDLLFQTLLDWGVDISLPIEVKFICNKQVFFVDQDMLAACFELDIDEVFIKELAITKPLRVVFRDSGFINDTVKINAEQLLKFGSPNTEFKTI